jgi:hypothetical protein
MDGDLQEPLDVPAGCSEKPAKVIASSVRCAGSGNENFVKGAAYALFDRLLTLIAEVNISLDAGDFCRNDKLYGVLAELDAEARLFPPRLAWLAGFSPDWLPAGTTKYPLRTLIRLARQESCFFHDPLRSATDSGLSGLGIPIFGGAFVLVWQLFGFEFMGRTAHALPGWAAIVDGMSFFWEV